MPWVLDLSRETHEPTHPNREPWVPWVLDLSRETLEPTHPAARRKVRFTKQNLKKRALGVSPGCQPWVSALGVSFGLVCFRFGLALVSFGFALVSLWSRLGLLGFRFGF